MKHSILPTTLVASFLASPLTISAETVYSDPVGYVSITCPANADTIVGVPLRQTASFSGATSEDPEVDGTDVSIVTLTFDTTFSTDYASAYYVLFTSGLSEGKFYEITESDTTTLTIDLNGDTLSAVSGDTVDVVKFWTLGDLFDPADSTTDPTTTGNAIVASTNTRTSGRRTQILLLDASATGINIPPSDFYFVDQPNARWTKIGDVSVDYGSVKLWPDTYFIVRNPDSVTSATKYTSSGQVALDKISIPLFTNVSGSQDNFIALPRPVDVTLDDLNLAGTPAFLSSTSTRTSGRTDTLEIFDNTAAVVNKPPSATYFVFENQWRKLGDVDVDAGTNVIPAGAGFLIRKKETETGETVFWTNSRSFLND